MLAIGVLALCHWRLYAGAWNAIDIGLWDETIYLSLGVELSWRNAATLGADGLLYRLYYRALALFIDDRIDVYLASFALTPFLVAAAMAAYLRAATGSRSLVVLVLPAFLILISTGTIEAWPRVTVFLAAFVLAGMTVVRRVRPPAMSMLAVAALGFAASYIRSEMVLAAIPALAAAAWLAAREPPPARRRLLAWCAGGAAAMLLIAGLLPYPPLDHAGRQQVAMGQHFAVNWVRWTGSPLEAYRDFEAVVAQAFGAGAPWWTWPLIAPDLVLRHLADNVAGLPAAVGRFFAHPPVAPPGTASAKLVEAAIVAAGVGGFAVLVLLREGRVFFRRNRLALAQLAILALPGLASAVLLLPRGHYLVLPMTLAFAAFGLALAQRAVGEGWPAARNALFLVAILVLTPPAMARRGSEPVRPTIATIEALRALRPVVPVRLLTHDFGYGAYLPATSSEGLLQDKGDRPFVIYLLQSRPDVIVYDPEVDGMTVFRGDTSWRHFTADPGAAGWRRLDVAGTQRRILFRSGLRCRHPACGP